MTEINPENSKDPKQDPASSNPNAANPAGEKGSNASSDLEKALETTKTQLRDLEKKLGEEKNMNNVKDPPTAARKNPPDADPIPQSNMQDVDQTLAALEADLAQLTSEVTQDEPAPSTRAISSPAPAPDNPVSATPPSADSVSETQSQNSIDDLLADLSDELDSIDEPDIASSPREAGELSHSPASEKAPDAEKSISPSVQDIIEQFPGETETLEDPQSSGNAVPVEPEEKDVQSIIENLPDVDSASEEDAPKAQAPAPEPVVSEPPKAQPKKPADDPFAAFAKDKKGKPKTPPPPPSPAVNDISEDEQVLLNELDQAEQNLRSGSSPAPASPSPVSVPVVAPGVNPYVGFSVPEKVLIYGLQTANKPFTFVGASTRDKIGLVAVVTLIVTMLTAGILLYFR